MAKMDTAKSKHLTQHTVQIHRYGWTENYRELPYISGVLGGCGGVAAGLGRSCGGVERVGGVKWGGWGLTVCEIAEKRGIYGRLWVSGIWWGWCGVGC